MLCTHWFMVVMQVRQSDVVYSLVHGCHAGETVMLCTHWFMVVMQVRQSDVVYSLVHGCHAGETE